MDTVRFRFRPARRPHRPAPRRAPRPVPADGRPPRLGTGLIEHRAFADLPDLLEPGDVLVRNNSRVVPARVVGRPRVDRRAVGGALSSGPSPTAPGRSWRRPEGRPEVGERVVVGSGLGLILESRLERLGEGRWSVPGRGGEAAEPLLEAHGQVPLPALHPQGDRGGRGPGAIPDGLRRRAGLGRRADGGAPLHPRGLRPPRPPGRGPARPDLARRDRHVPADRGRADRGPRPPRRVRRADARGRRRPQSPAGPEGGRVVAVGTTSARTPGDRRHLRPLRVVPGRDRLLPPPRPRFPRPRRPPDQLPPPPEQPPRPGSPPSPGSTWSGRPTARRSGSDTGSTATGTRCWSSDPAAQTGFLGRNRFERARSSWSGVFEAELEQGAVEAGGRRRSWSAGWSGRARRCSARRCGSRGRRWPGSRRGRARRRGSAGRRCWPGGSEGISISTCLLGIPWIAIWPADLPRIEGITARR